MHSNCYSFFYRIVTATNSVIFVLQLCVFLHQTTKPHPDVTRSDAEKYFRTMNGKELFPSLNEKCSINLSVVVPAYDEEKRCTD